MAEQHSCKCIARLMREAGLVMVSHRRGGPVTTRRDREARPTPDLVDRNFAAAPNRLWMADITYVPPAARLLYLAIVLDAYEDAMAESPHPERLKTSPPSNASHPPRLH